MASTSLVSVVTPFYNTHEYLAQCIESVLRQSYDNWEYILVDNQSTDGSTEIVAHYAARFPDKIRVIRTKSFLSQVQNYNFALSQISPHSKYCKMVQADDWIFPDCIRSMVEIAEVHPKVGIVSAYELEGNLVSLDGLPYPSPEVDGREICRKYLLEGTYLFGTPNSLLFRSDLVRSRSPFFDEKRAPFEDAHVCFDVLRTWNFGFVHQVLTFWRRDNESLLSGVRPFGGLFLSRFGLVKTHGPVYLSGEEYDRCFKPIEREYFLMLGRSALAHRSDAFWRFHRDGLRALGCPLSSWKLAKWAALAMLEALGNPKQTLESMWNRRRNSRENRTHPTQESSNTTQIPAGGLRPQSR